MNEWVQMKTEKSSRSQSLGDRDPRTAVLHHTKPFHFQFNMKYFWRNIAHGLCGQSHKIRTDEELRVLS